MKESYSPQKFYVALFISRKFRAGEGGGATKVSAEGA